MDILRGMQITNLSTKDVLIWFTTANGIDGTWALALRNLANEGLSVLSAAWWGKRSNRYLFVHYLFTNKWNPKRLPLLDTRWLSPSVHHIPRCRVQLQVAPFHISCGHSLKWKITKTERNLRERKKHILLTGYWAACSTFLTTVTGDSRAWRWSGCNCIHTWDADADIKTWDADMVSGVVQLHPHLTHDIFNIVSPSWTLNPSKNLNPWVWAKPYG